MNQEQKKFTVKQIEKYNAEIEEADKKARTWFILSAIALYAFGGAIHSDFLSPLQGLMGFALVSDFSLSVNYLAKKTGLEAVANNLQYQLDMAKLEKQNVDDEEFYEENVGRKL